MLPNVSISNDTGKSTGLKTGGRMKSFDFDRPGLSDFSDLRLELEALIPDKVLFRMIVLASEEIFVNVVSYSGATRLNVSIDRNDEGLFIVFSDNGMPFDPASRDEEKEFDELDAGGMGINMVKDISKEMSYERKDGRNVLSLVFDVDQP